MARKLTLEHLIILKALYLIKDEFLLQMNPRKFEAQARKLEKCI